MQTPNNYPFTHGWGVYPELPSYQEGRRFAAKRLLGHLDGSRMLDRRDFDWTMRKLEGMFLAVEAENTETGLTSRKTWGSLLARMLAKSERC